MATNCANPIKLSPEQMVAFWDQKGQVTVTRIPGIVVGRMQTRGYAYTWTSRPNTESNTLYIGVENGLQLRLIAEAERPKRTVTEDFYDYGVRITITPPC